MRNGSVLGASGSHGEQLRLWFFRGGPPGQTQTNQDAESPEAEVQGGFADIVRCYQGMSLDVLFLLWLDAWRFPKIGLEVNHPF